ncbi:hypothetical protein LSAT2_010826 [Lamellibrachia satsuma]|nr:hypothetical protein LSAT2_010826 [Lamellibrachia satsuma]
MRLIPAGDEFCRSGTDGTRFFDDIESTQLNCQHIMTRVAAQEHSGTMEQELHARDKVGVQDFVLLEDYTNTDAFIDNLDRRFKEDLIYGKHNFAASDSSNVMVEQFLAGLGHQYYEDPLDTDASRFHECEASLPNAGSLEQLASRFSEFFQDKVRLIQENLTLKADPNYVPPDESPGTVDDKLSICLPAMEDEVRQLVNKSPSKSCSLDPVPTWFLKEHLDCLLTSITNIVNLSMSTGIVPTKMKAVLVTPLLKKPSLDKDIMKNFRPASNLLKNFRPIFNLSFISKLTERVVLNRLIDHVSLNNLQEKFQSAYKPNHSTETALMRIQNDILITLDNKRGILLLLLDLSGAFDTVDHTLLLACMRSAGIIGIAHKWFDSYLTLRTQIVRLGQTQSDPLELLQGVPQGSILGPVLFTLYILPIW